MRASSFISSRKTIRSKAAVLSIAVSFAVMVVAICISEGFRYEIKNSLSNACGDIRLTCGPGEEEPERFDLDSTLVSDIESLKGVRQVRPEVYGTAVVRNGDNIHGVVFKGRDMGDSATTDVVIPRKLATLLKLQTGDRMTAYFIAEKMAIRNFTVQSVYDGIITDEDKLVVFCDMNTIRRAMGFADNEVSAIEIVLEPEYRTERRSTRLRGEINLCLFSDGRMDKKLLYASRVQESYPQLFEWLNLINNNVSFILILMMIVAAFNMVSGMLIFLFENISCIGLLKSMGMRDRDISRVFLLSSGRLVLKAMLWGNFVAVALMLAQKYTHLLSLNPDNYFISFVPVYVNAEFVLLCDLVAFLLIMLVLLIPSRFIARVDASRTIRVE